MRRFIQTNPFSNYTPSVSSAPTYGQSAMTSAAPASNSSQFNSNQMTGILQMLQMMRNRQQEPAQPAQSQGALSYGQAVSPSPFPSINVTGEKGNEQYFYEFNGRPMSIDQYNDMRLRRAEEAAQRGGYELLPARATGRKDASLFGPKYAPMPMTQKGVNAQGEYLARQRNSPEARAYAQKVSQLIQSGIPVGYGIGRRKDGTIVDGAGQRVTGYGFVDGSLTPRFITSGPAGPIETSMQNTPRASAGRSAAKPAARNRAGRSQPGRTNVSLFSRSKRGY